MVGHEHLSLLSEHGSPDQEWVDSGREPALLVPVLRAEVHAEPKAQGYPPEVRRQALRMYVDGGNLRRIGRALGVVHQTVANWVTAASDALPDAPPVPDRVATAELDELYTFVTDNQTVPTASRR
jgi:transposase-like protein